MGRLVQRATADRYTPEVRLTPQEYKRLLTCTRGSGRPGCHRYYALWVLLGNLGLRITEALAVRLEDLQIGGPGGGRPVKLPVGRDVDCRIRLHTLKQRRRRKATTTVEMRVVHPQVVRVLLAWARRARLQPTDRLFSMARQTAWEAFIRYRDLAGLPKGVSLHSLRHFRGDQDYQATRDVRWVAYRLRHKGLAHVSRYTRVGAAQEEELVQKIGAIT
ncbi:MAG: tyrosine-type recombinase/integrase [Candidatus Methylomirabilales bacterium]